MAVNLRAPLSFWLLLLLLFHSLVRIRAKVVQSEDKVILQSPRVTSYGIWGSWDDCPKGSFVRAMQIKTDPDHGKLGDNTAMNGVRLCCSFPGYSNCVKWIKSSEGPVGKWGGIGYCGGKTAANGFVLRQDEFVRKVVGKHYDNTASNNMNLLCQDDSIIQGDGLNGGYWDWEDPKECPHRQMICGLRTQIVPPQGIGDDSGLNNVDLKCCKRCDDGAVCA